MERKKASKIGAQKSPVSKVWLCKFYLSILSCLWSPGGIGNWRWRRWLREDCILGIKDKLADDLIQLITDMLLFVVCGGLLFEGLRLIFGFFE